MVADLKPSDSEKDQSFAALILFGCNNASQEKEASFNQAPFFESWGIGQDPNQPSHVRRSRLSLGDGIRGANKRQPFQQNRAILGYVG